MKKTFFAAALIASYFASAQIVKTDTIDSKKIEPVELFGVKNRQPEGLEIITRMPLKTRDQIQSISVLSTKVIEDLGGLTLTDVVKNVPGVTQFSSYGGTKESMTLRGFRGVPVLKNGVKMETDFRRSGMLTDMQGVETIQVIKGSAAITQGIGNGLGDAGGVINIVTKKPHFINAGSVGFRAGSWDNYRPFFDVQRVLDSQGRVAFRLNSAYQKGNSFRHLVEKESFYINPSIAFRPDDKTEIVAEMDYFNGDNTPDQGTRNIAPESTYALYTMPKDKFMGFKGDNNHTENFNYAITVNRKLSDNFKLRAAYFNNDYYQDLVMASIITPKGTRTDYAKFLRNRTRTEKHDRNQTFQMDFIGKDVKTGPLKHTFQIGGDFSQVALNQWSYDYPTLKKAGNVVYIDEINLLENISNELPAPPQGKQWEFTNRKESKTPIAPTFGFMAQDVMTINKYVKTSLGIRYSRLNGAIDKENNDAWNPSFGILVSPIENVNVFGSYTNTTSLRGANNKKQDGSVIGPQKTNQFEAGIKSDWFNERLRFNVTYFNINTANLSYEVLNQNFQSYNPRIYELAGNLKRSGVEIEAIGRILPNLQVMAGWAYLDARFQNSPAYIDNSRPSNAPWNTANGWLNYKFSQGALRGLDLGFGAYYIGARPTNEWTKRTVIQGHANQIQAGVKPLEMKAYTTLDAQIGYEFKNFAVRIFANNLTNEVNYTSYYRGGYIDQIAPRNYSGQVIFKF